MDGKQQQRKFTPLVIVHGGTWASARHGGTGLRGQRRRRAAEEAARLAYAILMTGGSCVDATEAAVCAMEDCPLFRVGAAGASANAAGEVEMDAIITEGRRSVCGAVLAVQNVANPIKAARAVMEKTQHIMFSGRPATEFAHSCGFGPSSAGCDAATARIDPLDQETSELRKRQQCQGGQDVPAAVSTLERRRSSLRVGGNSTGTSVGAIAIDAFGRVACAASCGSATGGLSGRVNESAILGLGVYAVHRIGGAVACSRNGEALARTSLAYAVCRRMGEGATAQEAARAVLCEATAASGAGPSAGARLGVITLSKAGEFGVYFTAGQMPWAAMTAGQIMSGLGSEFDVAADALACLGPEPLISSSPTTGIAAGLRQPIVLVHGGAGSWDVVRGYELDVTCYYDGVKAAAVAGYTALQAGGSALDAVVAAVRNMEDDPTFNAGRGSRYTSRRTVEMDAMVMDGRDGGRAAGVATVSNVRNPVLLAKAVLEVMAATEGTAHGSLPTLLVDAGAVGFARSAGLELAEDSYFESPTSDLIFAKDTSRHCKQLPASATASAARRGSFSDRKRRSRGPQQQLEQQSLAQAQRRRSLKQAPICVPTLCISRTAREGAAPYDAAAARALTHIGGGGALSLHDYHHQQARCSAQLAEAACRDVAVRAQQQQPPASLMQASDTVGAVAVDAYGNVACATSTGGKNFKLSGRVGDSPIVGCGGYADNAVGAISTTGSGEFIARSVLARAVMDKAKAGVSIREAAMETIKESTKSLGHFSVGLVAVDRDGTPVVAFNTEGMSWAMVKDCRLSFGLHRDDSLESGVEVSC